MKFLKPNPFHGFTQDLRLSLARHPRAFYGLLHLFGRPINIVGEETEIVIEGFPRCANGFFVRMFEFAQQRRILIAHHQHSVAQIVEGIRRSLPIVLLVRDPKDVVISLQAFSYQAFDVRRKEDAGLTPDRILDRYIQFHSHAMKFKEDIVVSDFEDTVKNPNRTIERINQRFGKNYKGVENLLMNTLLVFSRSNERVRRDRMRDNIRSCLVKNLRQKLRRINLLKREGFIGESWEHMNDVLYLNTRFQRTRNLGDYPGPWAELHSLRRLRVYSRAAAKLDLKQIPGCAMFFVMSKVLNFFLPSNILVSLGLAGIALLTIGYARAGRWMLVASIVLIAAVAICRSVVGLRCRSRRGFRVGIRRAGRPQVLSCSAGE